MVWCGYQVHDSMKQSRWDISLGNWDKSVMIHKIDFNKKEVEKQKHSQPDKKMENKI